MKHDEDKDGKISLDEFIKYGIERDKNLKLGFMKIDTNQDGMFYYLGRQMVDFTDSVITFLCRLKRRHIGITFVGGVVVIIIGVRISLSGA